MIQDHLSFLFYYIRRFSPGCYNQSLDNREDWIRASVRHWQQCHLSVVINLQPAEIQPLYLPTENHTFISNARKKIPLMKLSLFFLSFFGWIFYSNSIRLYQWILEWLKGREIVWTGNKSIIPQFSQQIVHRSAKLIWQVTRVPVLVRIRGKNGHWIHRWCRPLL